MTAEFDALDRGYLGWRWSVTMALVEPGHPTISEVVLLPGSGALLAPPWVPWDRRIRPGDLGAGGLLPTAPDDVRLVPGYVESEDPAIEDLEHELGIGRPRVLSREGRDDAAQRWHDGPFGPEDTIAQLAPGQCVTCGFYVPLAGRPRRRARCLRQRVLARPTGGWSTRRSAAVRIRRPGSTPRRSRRSCPRPSTNSCSRFISVRG